MSEPIELKPGEVATFGRPKWEEEFDKRFEGYWRGQAIPDELKFFFSKTLEAVIDEIPDIDWGEYNPFAAELKQQLRDEFL